MPFREDPFLEGAWYTGKQTEVREVDTLLKKNFCFCFEVACLLQNIVLKASHDPYNCYRFYKSHSFDWSIS